MPVEEVGETSMEERAPCCPKACSLPLERQQEEEGKETPQ